MKHKFQHQLSTTKQRRTSEFYGFIKHCNWICFSKLNLNQHKEKDAFVFQLNALSFLLESKKKNIKLKEIPRKVLQKTHNDCDDKFELKKDYSTALNIQKQLILSVGSERFKFKHRKMFSIKSNHAIFNYVVVH